MRVVPAILALSLAVNAVWALTASFSVPTASVEVERGRKSREFTIEKAPERRR